MTKYNLREEYLKAIPEMITTGNDLCYSEWLEQIIIGEKIIKPTYILECKNNIEASKAGERNDTDKETLRI